MLSLDTLRLYILPQTSRVDNEFYPVKVAEIVNLPLPQPHAHFDCYSLEFKPKRTKQMCGFFKILVGYSMTHMIKIELDELRLML